MSDVFRIVIAGQEYAEWTGGEVTLSMLQAAGTFNLNLFERFPPGNNNRRLDFYRGNPVEIYLGDDLLITGWIDARPVGYDSQNHSVSVSGRDKVGDLADCSYVGTKKQWLNTKLETICSDLCQPFGIEVITKVDTGRPIRDFRIDEGATIISQIYQLCDYRGTLALSYGDGNLYIDRLGKNLLHDRLELGLNILSMSAEQDAQDRFSEYIVKGQAQSDDGSRASSFEEKYNAIPGKKDEKPKNVYQQRLEAAGRIENVTEALLEFRQSVVEAGDEDDEDATKTTTGWEPPNYESQGKAYDSEVKRYRPMVIIMDGDVTSADCAKRARWEAWTRNGASRQLTYTVKGYRQSNGDLWRINNLVQVIDPWAWLSEQMVVTETRFSLDENDGPRTELKVALPYMFNPYSQKEADVGKEEAKTSGPDKILSLGIDPNTVSAERFEQLIQVYLKSVGSLDEARKMAESQWYRAFGHKKKPPVLPNTGRNSGQVPR